MSQMVQSENVHKKIDCYSYGIRNVIGKGFSSTVYKGRNDNTKQVVAVKVINLQKIVDDNLKQLLYSEICVLKKLTHPNILKCYQVYMTANNCYIITEYCNDGDLATLTRNNIRLGEKEAVDVMLQVGRGLQYLSSMKLMHRDIKPANIFMHGGLAKIGDFGFAKYVTVEGYKQTYNVGSPMYMSPKVLLDSIYSLKNDVWSFGISLYEVLYGFPPWRAKNSKELKQEVFSKINFIFPISKQLEQLINQCVEVDQQKRLNSQTVRIKLQKISQSFNRKLQPKHQSRTYGFSISKRPQNLGNDNQVLKVFTSQQPQKNTQIEQSIRNNHKIIKAIIDYCRFLYKLYQKIIQMTILFQSDKTKISTYICSLLKYLMNILKSTLNTQRPSSESDQKQIHNKFITLTNFKKFTATICFEKLNSVVNQYYYKYSAFLIDKQIQQFQQDPFSSHSIVQILIPLTISKGLKNNDLVGLDFLISLVLYNKIISKYGLSQLYRQGNIQAVASLTPFQITEQHLNQIILKKNALQNQFSLQQAQKIQ